MLVLVCSSPPCFVLIVVSCVSILLLKYCGFSLSLLFMALVILNTTIISSQKKLWVSIWVCCAVHMYMSISGKPIESGEWKIFKCGQRKRFLLISKVWDFTYFSDVRLWVAMSVDLLLSWFMWRKIFFKMKYVRVDEACEHLHMCLCCLDWFPVAFASGS